MMKEKALVVLIALGALLSTVWFFAINPSRAAPSTATATASASTSASTRGNQRSAERDSSGVRFQLLEQRLQEVEQELVTRPNAADAVVEAAEPEPAALPDPVEAAASNTRKIAVLAEVLKSESRDPKWSRDTETAIERVFREGDFKGSTLGPVECRSTFCAARVRHEDVVSRQLFERLGSSIPGMGVEFLYREGPDGTLETAAYFIRPDRDATDHPARQSY